ncbi:MAG: monovalent cation/H(+) antiporter subunit G [Oscillospiraceae bacterium]|jgi:multicomponent Na+:H+ antiporter subunit G|nr:monovalent cation/H(+) antiporter subunit G [Oscillospiraceae bacterium]
MAVRIIADVLILIGAFFATAGTIGILKMPDAFSRMQASTCVSTLGMLGAMLGALVYAIFVMGSASAAVKIALIALLIFVTNPLGSHAIAKGAYRHGIRPDKPMEVDDFGRDFDE